MRHRILTFLCGLAVVVGVFAVDPQVEAQRFGPEGPKATDTSVPTKTSWGAPSLEGIWAFPYQAPLQRLKKYAGRERLTPAELKALNDRRSKSIDRDYRPTPGQPTEADVAGAYNAIWGPSNPSSDRTSLIVDPPDGRLPPTTPEFRRAGAAKRAHVLGTMAATEQCKNKEDFKKKFGRTSCEGGTYDAAAPKRNDPSPDYNLAGMNRADGPEDHPAGDRCLGNQLPAITALQRIVQSSEAVAIYYDIGQGGGFSRVIPINNNPHLAAGVQQRYGDARARWEGNTLVVDVTNFSYRTNFQGSRQNLHLVERFTRTGPNTLDYKVTVEDPTVWTKPWTALVDMIRYREEPNQIYQQTCHEGNYGLVGMLAGARAAEQAFAEGRGPNPASIDLFTRSQFFRREDDDVFTLADAE
jgi:hypothetical protein